MESKGITPCAINIGNAIYSVSGALSLDFTFRQEIREECNFKCRYRVNAVYLTKTVYL